MTDTGSAAKAINPAKAKPFANYSNGMLADEMGDIDRKIDHLKELEKAARAEMTRRKVNSIAGARFIVVKAVNEIATFDSKAVRAEMGDDWYEARQRDGTRTTYTVMAKPPEDTPPPDAPLDAVTARAAAEALFKVAA